jgi:hypothetical protein
MTSDANGQSSNLTAGLYINLNNPILSDGVYGIYIGGSLSKNATGSYRGIFHYINLIENTVADAYGIYSNISGSSATVSGDAYGIYSRLSAGLTVTNSYGLYIKTESIGSNSSYGLYIDGGATAVGIQTVQNIGNSSIATHGINSSIIYSGTISNQTTSGITSYQNVGGGSNIGTNNTSYGINSYFIGSGTVNNLVGIRTSISGFSGTVSTNTQGILVAASGLGTLNEGIKVQGEVHYGLHITETYNNAVTGNVYAIYVNHSIENTFSADWVGAYINGAGEAGTITGDMYGLRIDTSGYLATISGGQSYGIRIDTTPQATTNYGIYLNGATQYGISINSSFSSDPGTYFGIYNISGFNAASTGTIYGYYLDHSFTNTLSGSWYGQNIRLTGEECTISNNVYGSYVDLGDYAGSITLNSYAIYAKPTSTGALNYGVYINNASNPDYGFYVTGSSVNNYIAGHLDIGGTLDLSGGLLKFTSTGEVQNEAKQQFVADNGTLSTSVVSMTSAYGFIVVGDNEYRTEFSMSSDKTITFNPDLDSTASMFVANSYTDGFICINPFPEEDVFRIDNKLGEGKNIWYVIWFIDEPVSSSSQSSSSSSYSSSSSSSSSSEPGPA